MRVVGYNGTARAGNGSAGARSNGRPMIRLLCVEDDPLVRTYLATRLALEPDVRVAGVVSSAGEAIAFLRREAVDLVLLDYQLEGADGMQLLGALARAQAPHPTPRVLFCTGLADETFEAAARALGAAGVVAKTRMAAELLPALRAVSEGKQWFRAQAASPLAAAVEPQWRVLVAEDDPGVRALLDELLPLIGCTVRLVWRAEDVICILEREAFDLLLLDHQLAGPLLGTQILGQLAERWPNLPILVVTGHPCEVEQAPACTNVRGVIEKPFRIQQLQAEILRVLQT